MTFATELLAHQRAAVDKLMRLRVGALFMDMRTGKSRAAMHLAKARLDAGKATRVLWFCPVDSRGTIREEFDKHLPGASVHAFDDKTCVGNLPAAGWHIIGLESLSSSIRVMEASEALAPGAFIIVDESSLITSDRAIRTRRLLRLGAVANYRLILDGTPIGNGIEDLYAPMTFLSWKILGYSSFRDFSRHHLEFAQDGGRRRITKRHNIPAVMAKIAPYVFQVRRHECFDLPPETWASHTFAMTRDQRSLYEQAKRQILYGPEAFTWSDSTIYRLFTALQQVTCGYWNRTTAPVNDDDESDAPGVINLFPDPMDNPRVKLLLSLVDRVSADQQVVVWGKYRFDIDQASATLRRRHGDSAVLTYDGRVKPSDRDAARHAFRSGAARFLVANEAVAARTIDLSCAAYSIYHSTGFKARQRRQSEARIHGPNQTHAVSYLDVVCENSIDDKIIAPCLRRKQDAAVTFRDMLHRVRDERSKSKRAGEKMLRQLMGAI